MRGCGRRLGLTSTVRPLDGQYHHDGRQGQHGKEAEVARSSRGLLAGVIKSSASRFVPGSPKEAEGYGQPYDRGYQYQTYVYL